MRKKDFTVGLITGLCVFGTVALILLTVYLL